MHFATFVLSLVACNDNTGGTTQDDTSAVQDPDDTETPSTDDPSSDDDTDTDDEATYICYKPVQGYDYTEGDEIEHITYYSSVAGADKHANVILPVDYDPEKSYPVLYLLHGLMSDEYSWIDGVYNLEMGANYIVQNAHYFDGAPEMIVVCVNSPRQCHGGRSPSGICSRPPHLPNSPRPTTSRDETSRNVSCPTSTHTTPP